MHTLIILGGNRQSRELGALIRIVATIIFFPLWVTMIIKCGNGKSDFQKIKDKYDVKIVLVKDSLITENKVVRTDTSIIQYNVYYNPNWKYTQISNKYEFIPNDRASLHRTLNSIQKKIEKDLKKRLEKEEKWRSGEIR